jgi:hypothetical protein
MMQAKRTVQQQTAAHNVAQVSQEQRRLKREEGTMVHIRVHVICLHGCEGLWSLCCGSSHCLPDVMEFRSTRMSLKVSVRGRLQC